MLDGAGDDRRGAGRAILDIDMSMERSGAAPDLQGRLDFERGLLVREASAPVLTDVISRSRRDSFSAWQAGGGKSTIASLIPPFYDPIGSHLSSTAWTCATSSCTACA
jgi:hypothetical protein